MNRKLTTNSSQAGKVRRWTRPNGLSADQCSAHWAAGWTRVTAATNVKADTATLTSSRPTSDRVLFRRGKKRSRANRSAKNATATSVVTRAFKPLLQLAARGRLIDR